MQIGLLDRPDLAAERAQVIRAAQAIRSARSQYLPTAHGRPATPSTIWVNINPTGVSVRTTSAGASPSRSSTVFGWQYAVRAATLTADAEASRLRNMEQQVALQVYESYQELRTATVSVTTAESW